MAAQRQKHLSRPCEDYRDMFSVLLFYFLFLRSFVCFLCTPSVSRARSPVKVQLKINNYRGARLPTGDFGLETLPRTHTRALFFFLLSLRSRALQR